MMLEKLSSRWWVNPLALFILSQALLTLMLLAAKDSQVSIDQFFGDQFYVPGYGANPPWEQYVAQWNGWGYREIAANGYPSEIYYYDSGRANPSPWAFFPLFPFVCSLFMGVGLPFGYAAILVSFSSALAACLILYRWIETATESRWKATLASLTITLFPSAALFQLAYAESLALLLVVATLRLVSAHRYLLAAPVVILLGLTRPVGVPDFIVFVIHGALTARLYLHANNITLRETLQDTKTLIKNTWRYFVLLAASALSAVLWVTVGIIVTGENAYFRAREGFSPDQALSWFTTSFDNTENYPNGSWYFLVIFIGWAAWIAFSKTFNSYPLVLRIWPLVSTIYVFIFTSPVGNQYRYLILSLFVYPALTMPAKKKWKIVYFAVLALAVLAAIYLQYAWVNEHWLWDGGFKHNV